MHFAFSKYEGTGNDFILIDNRNEDVPLESVNIPKLCHRQYGIGADGFIFLGNSTQADVSMRIFNSDGREAEMCGNGLRCLVRFLKDTGNNLKKIQVETLKKVYLCEIVDGGIQVRMGVPEILQEQKEEMLINVGVPHLVVFVEDLDRFDREAKERFSVLGVNINYAKITSSGSIMMRTFERGVEQETLSCGTGATAVCLGGWKRFGLKNQVEVLFHSKERLWFDLCVEGEVLKEIYMRGQVRFVFDGKVRL